MNESEVKSAIAAGVRVSRSDVMLAKASIAKNVVPQTDAMLRTLLRELEAVKPERLWLAESAPIEPQIVATTNWIRWTLAFIEAVWGLIQSGTLIPSSSDLVLFQPALDWSDGRYSSGLRFEEFNAAYPHEVRLAPSLANGMASPFSDADLYLKEIDIPDLHVDVAEALRQAVLCFRLELYVPCLAMLSKASEGAWIELGLSLLRVAPTHHELPAERRQKLQATLESFDASLAKKIRTVVDLYASRQDVFGEVKSQSGYDPQHLREAEAWANIVRDARRPVHYGVVPLTTNTYEKVAILLIAATQNLRAIYSIRRAAEAVSAATQ